MDASEFRNYFGADADYWETDPTHPVEDWQFEVSNDDTRLGYWDWVINQRELATDKE